MARILLVDDEVLNTMANAALLARHGHEVREAYNGVGALRHLECFSPDLIITDYMMPLMDGAELVGRIRDIPPLDEVRIILATAVTEASVKDRIAFDRYLGKPFRDSQLLAAVDDLLKL